MLVELIVRDLGVIEQVSLLLGPGMTALTGETGAGKTLLVEAIELLVGGRADGVLVRPGAAEARVEGRFVDGDGTETVLARVVPRTGRSRGYIDGAMATAAALAHRGESLVDLHGQHAHQSLLSPAVQRAALDRFGAIDLDTLVAARRELRDIERDLGALGGDARARARELDLLRFQLAELAGAGLVDPDEEIALEADEEALADATAHREAAAAAHDALDAEGGAIDVLRGALAGLAGRAPLAELDTRLEAAVADLTDLASDLRTAAETLADDPERLEQVRTRRRALHDLRRKYGESLREVMAYATTAAERLGELESFDARAAELDGRRTATAARIAACERAVGAARRAAAPDLARAVEAHLRTLALPSARFEVGVGPTDPGDEVVFAFSANAGEPPLPLAKVGSGGELARAMLAARLVLTGGPPTMVFDEVDAGIGGAAALSVGHALANLAAADDSQVLVVTHLAQVAAAADHQVAVAKRETGGRTIAEVRPVREEDRIIELSRMLSGQPDSESGRRHAAELLASGGRGGTS